MMYLSSVGRTPAVWKTLHSVLNVQRIVSNWLCLCYPSLAKSNAGYFENLQKQPVNREVFALLTAQRPVAAAAPDKNIISKESGRINF
jgi:hypothetical protein